MFFKENALVKVKVLIQLLYSSKSEKVQALECNQSIKVNSRFNSKEFTWLEHLLCRTQVEEKTLFTVAWIGDK